MPSNGGNRWAALALPDVLAARARNRFRRMLLLYGIPADRTIFLPHSYTWLLFPGGLKLRRNWRGLPAEVLSNVRSHMALEAVGIEASDQVARTGGMCRFGANRGGEI